MSFVYELVADILCCNNYCGKLFHFIGIDLTEDKFFCFKYHVIILTSCFGFNLSHITQMGIEQDT